MRRQKVLRGAHDALLLAPHDTRRRTSISALRPRTHFDEHERTIALAHHEIDLATATRDVTRNEAQSLPLKKRQRMRFERCPDGFGPSASGKVVGASRGIARTLG